MDKFVIKKRRLDSCRTEPVSARSSTFQEPQRRESPIVSTSTKPATTELSICQEPQKKMPTQTTDEKQPTKKRSRDKPTVSVEKQTKKKSTVPSGTKTPVAVRTSAKEPEKKNSPELDDKENDDDDENGTENESHKSFKQKTYPFLTKWLEIKEFKHWLTTETVYGKELAKCKFCQTIIHNHKPHLYRHNETEKHKNIMTAIRLSTPIKQALNQTEVDKMARRAEIKLSALLATNNLPFLLCDTLVPLIANICPDSKIAQKMSMGRTKATEMVHQVLGCTYMANTAEYLRNPGNFFSVIMDETTDQGSVKQCAITVIYADNAHKIKTFFFDMVEMASGTAEDLFKALLENLNKKEIPLQNLVGFSSDTCNTMVGQHNSVFSHLKDVLPNIACVKCSCHMIHLAASKACLKLPRSIEDLLRDIGSHFSRSYGRQKKLEEMQIFFKVDLHKILSPAITRWLSLKACVDRVLEQLPALVAYFRVECYEDPSRTTESIHNTLKNKFTKVYLEFMSYSLDLLNEFNVMFQSEAPLLYKLQPETDRLIRTLASNFMSLKHVKETNNAYLIQHDNPHLYLPLDKLYIGVQAQETIMEIKAEPNPPPQTDIDRVLLDCLNFYIEVIAQIKKRFDFSDPLYKIISIVDPTISVNQGPAEMMQILYRFPILKEHINVNSLMKEFREYTLLDLDSVSISSALPADQYWQKIFRLSDVLGNAKFPNLSIAIGLLLILPFSNASVERVFSKLKKIKTESRTQLKSQNLVSLMVTSAGVQDAGGVLKFEPSTSMLHSKIKYS